MKQLEETEKLVTLDVGATATAEAKKRMVRSALPNLTNEQLEQIDSEIDAAVEEAEAAAAFEQEQREAMLAEGVDPDAPPPDDEGDDDAAPPANAPPAKKASTKKAAKKTSAKKSPTKKGAA